jgi:hypothetical protein
MLFLSSCGFLIFFLKTVADWIMGVICYFGLPLPLLQVVVDSYWLHFVWLS